MSDIDPQALRNRAESRSRGWSNAIPDLSAWADDASRLLRKAADTIEAHEQALDWQAAIIRALLDDQKEARAEVKAGEDSARHFTLLDHELREARAEVARLRDVLITAFNETQYAYYRPGKRLDRIAALISTALGEGTQEECPAGHGSQCCGHPAMCRIALEQGRGI